MDVICLGSRVACYKVLYKNPNYNIIKIFTFLNTPLYRLCLKEKKNFEIIDENQGDYVINLLLSMKYDLLVVNGCPFILPAKRLNAQGKILLNTHSSYLPFARGKSPVVGSLYTNKPIGVTTHFIVDKIDAGNIIYQEKVELTPDIDLGLAYYICQILQEKVFSKAISILESNHFLYKGNKNKIQDGFLFIDNDSFRVLDFTNMTVYECQSRVRASSIGNKGCVATLCEEKYMVMEVEPIVNKYLLVNFCSLKSGEIVLEYDNKLLVKCIDGILKIKKYYKI